MGVAAATFSQNSKNFWDPPLFWISLFFLPYFDALFSYNVLMLEALESLWKLAGLLLLNVLEAC